MTSFELVLLKKRERDRERDIVNKKETYGLKTSSNKRERNE